MGSQDRNLETAHRYIELYNDDIERFVPECYSEDCVVYAMGGGVIEGPEKFLEVERKVLRAAPKRRMRLDAAHVSGDAVAVEVTLLDPDAGSEWAIPFAAVLTMRGGKIAVDRSYADWSEWPGLGELAGGAWSLVSQDDAVITAGPGSTLGVAKRYVDLYNTDPERFVRECYHSDYRVGAMGEGWFEGIDKFVEIERAVCAAAPRRRMRPRALLATDQAVVVEAAVVDPDRGEAWELPFCAVLEIRGDKIAVDRTYADFRAWPGLDL